MTVKQLVVAADLARPATVEVLPALAVLAARDGKVVLLDADVRGGTLAESLNASPVESVRLAGREVAVISPSRCNGCGVCVPACRLCAVHRTDSLPVIDSAICEACHSCFYQCPAHAIDMLQLETGTWNRSASATGTLFWGRLDAGQLDTGKLLNMIRLEARTDAKSTSPSTLIAAAPADSDDAVASCLIGGDLLVLLVDSSQDVSRLGRLAALAAMARVRAMALHIAWSEVEPLRGQVESACRELGLVLLSAPRSVEATAAPAPAPSVVESLGVVWPVIRRQLWTG